MTSTATEVRTLDAQTLQERLAGAEPPRVVDVRTPAEFETPHIPGAYNVPLTWELERHVQSVAGPVAAALTGDDVA